MTLFSVKIPLPILIAVAFLVGVIISFIGIWITIFLTVLVGGLTVYNSLVYIPDGKFGVIKTNFFLLPSVPSNWPHRLVPKWYNGTWAHHLINGWRLLFLHKIWAKIELRDVPVIPNDKRGYIIALIGAELPTGIVMQIEEYDFSDAEAFIRDEMAANQINTFWDSIFRWLGIINIGKAEEKKHYRGPSAKIWSPGPQNNIFAKVINEDESIPANEAWPFVFKLISSSRAEAGRGIVLIAQVGDVPSENQWVKVTQNVKDDKGNETTKETTIEGLVEGVKQNKIEELKVLKRGVQNRAFGPGEYFFHPVMFKVLPDTKKPNEPLDTTPINVCFKGTGGGDNFPAVDIITKDPYTITIEFEIGIRVPLNKLPMLVAKNEDIKGLKNDVIVPQANGILYEVASIMSLQEFIESREKKFTTKVVGRFKTALNEEYADFLYFKLLDVKLSDAAKVYADVLTRQIQAVKEEAAVVQETLVAKQTVALRRQRAEGDAQDILVGAEFRKEAAKNLAEAATTRGNSLNTLNVEMGAENPFVKLALLFLSMPDGLNMVLEGFANYLQHKDTTASKSSTRMSA